MLRWTVSTSVLELFEPDGSLVYQFDSFTLGQDGSAILSASEYSPSHGAVLVSKLDEPQTQEGQPALRVRQRAQGVPRRNLLILRANEHSLHPRWWESAGSNAHRNWDFAISFYGQPESFGRDAFAEFQISQQADRKYHAIYDLFYANSPLWSYDYVAFPDDDMLTTCADINRMFDYASRYELLLSQPALSGHLTHPITRCQREYLLRFTSFVEPIAPWFSREALRICAPTFNGTLSGYGLDHIWPKLLGEPRNRLAIIDDVVFAHTRPVAQNYDMETALAEGWECQMRYGAYPKELDYGGIFRDPIDRFQKW